MILSYLLFQSFKVSDQIYELILEVKMALFLK